ncbi:AbrB/MazE/SpoVT family DNA-binding domain-containing protein [Marinihelvus fidelis]|uniref:AbrB/MazE/SpoVT family DNA-binding domain-containing protein n=1 Tax=Marinihelvus fidelis TaxID=2613842 RepID=A0A5N0TIU2_9GAMM|nr:AbrB/MazE/SpoVT family DNA-binding domain-containing protein [Marinihelvus fidelis]KAA9134017.1 AbrB/MazE/SpoVT family DNA-binding domain-containing protein [Marinihelvus fidelis]
MSKITSKLQVTIPKRLAEAYGITPGDEVEFRAAGDIIHLVPAGQRQAVRLSLAERKRAFAAATARQREREKRMTLPKEPPADRGWTREELYDRDKAR